MSDATQTNITELPAWAQPYAKETLGKAQALTDINQNPYQQYTGERIAQFSPLQERAFQSVGAMQPAQQLDTATSGAQTAMNRALGASYSPTQASYLQAYAPQLQQFQMGPAERVYGGQYNAPTMSAAQTGFQPNLQQFQMGPAERVGADVFGGRQAARYMSPFIEQALAPQLREAQRSSEMQRMSDQAQAVRSGAFGGSRQAIVEAERQRNLGMLQGDIRARGLQSAYEQATQQFNQDAARRMQAQQLNQQAGLTVGGQNLAAQLGVQQLGTQTGLQTSLANLSSQQQANVQNQAAQLQAQGLTAGQAMQAALANQQAGLTVGGQNLQALLGTQQLGSGQSMQAQLANQQAMQQAQQLQEQSRQYGAGLGMQGIGLGLQGAGLMGQLGQSQFGQAKDIVGLQGQFGTQQQQLGQQTLNQQYQDFLNQERYPYQQLEFMSNMLRGTPMGTVQTMYAQPPSTLQNIGSLGLGAYGLKQLFGAKEGGQVEGYARGGSVTDEGNVKRIVDDLSEAQLAQAKQAAMMRGDVARLEAIAEEEAMRASERRGMAGMYNSLPSSVQNRMAGGGIVAFSRGGEPNSGSAADVINAALEQEPAGSAADVINAALDQDSAGSQSRYEQALDAALGRLQAISNYKPTPYTQEELDKIFERNLEREQKFAGDAPYSAFKNYLTEAESGRPQAMRQAKGLAALKAMSAILQPGGTMRGLGAAGAAFAGSYGTALQADRAEKRAIASMKFNLADAQRKERMGMARSAREAASEAVKDRRAAEQAHVQRLGIEARIAGETARAAKPTAQKAPSEAKLNEQLAAAEIAYENDKSPANLRKVTALRRAAEIARTSEFGPDRIATMMAGITGQQGIAELRSQIDAMRIDQQTRADINKRLSDAKYSQEYMALKTPAERKKYIDDLEQELINRARQPIVPRPGAGAAPTRRPVDSNDPLGLRR
jgi:hypothetical protein